MRRAGALVERGLGGALMRYAIERCDADKMLAYLESSNPRNIPLYERHGFEVMGEIKVGAGPTVTPMLRRPR
jgi:ribosomal protein S18 acetylase RimI-like enzyme